MNAAPDRYRIALLCNYFDRPYQTSFYNALERVARSRGVELLVVVGRELENELAHERALNQVYKWLSPERIDGVIILSAALSNFSGPEGVLRLCHELLPVPSCSIGLRLPDVPSILIDNRAAMRAATSHLISAHRCRQLGYIGGPDYNEEARLRYLGYRDALDNAQLPFDERRVTTGNFTTESGHLGLLELLARDAGLDGLLAANDNMALGAVDALLEAGLRVPEDVRVLGFDDAPVARFARRSLTTVAQPFDDMAGLALDALLGQLRGQPPPTLQCPGVRLVARESCGCGYVLPRNDEPETPPRLSAPEFLRNWAAELDRRSGSGVALQLWETAVPELARGLATELEGEAGTFLRSVEGVADELERQRQTGDELSRALSGLLQRCQEAGYRGSFDRGLERACLEGRAKASAISHREHGRRALVVLDSAAGIRSVSQQLAMMLSPTALAGSFRNALRQLSINTGYLGMCAEENGDLLRPLLTLEHGEVLSTSPAPYPARQLFPNNFPSVRGEGLILLPLTMEARTIGLVALASSTEPFVCEALRSQLSAALEMGALHARVVEETAIHERLAREQLLGELVVARRIQGALAPSELNVPGFELAAELISADQVGGDYYDVFPCEDGCWLAIGDVTGHGLLAGLLMLMMQSSVSTAVRGPEERSPAEVTCHVNRVLYSNIRSRLKVKDHATFMILRARTNGRVVMAGAHEDVIIHRKATGRCEFVETTGMWLGISPDISDTTEDSAFELGEGDTAVLYTDGLIEARDAAGEELGMERVCELIMAHAEQGPQAVAAALMAGARRWAPVQQDDISVVVMRRR
jgi:DNA-binding LacI/PurR family transcriptional regulator/serine phosphatase RsbU (regulator of sigma subunit)